MSVLPPFDGPSSAAPSAQLNALPELVMRLLDPGLDRTFDFADEALFDLSCHAGNDHGQHRYFEGLRQLRLARKAIHKRFRELVIERWRVQTGMRAAGALQTSSPEGMALELISEEELEQRLTVDGIVARSEVAMGAVLPRLQIALSTRLGRGLHAVDCAIGPRGLCEAILGASGTIDVSLTVRLVLLECFESLVISLLPDIYPDVIRVLADGVGVAANVEAIAPAPGRAALDASRGRDAPPSQRSAGALKAPADHVEPAKRVHAVDSRIAGRSAIEARNAGGLRAVALGGFHAQPESAGTRLAGVDREIPDRSSARAIIVADAVQKLFKGAGMAPDMAPELEAAVYRLEVPMVRVALAQPQLLKDPEHPARRFLAQLARFTRRWGRHPPSDAALLDRLAGAHRLADGDVRARIAFFENEALFLERAAADQLRRVQLTEQRAREAETGKARLRDAEAFVSRLLDRWPELKRLPAPLGDVTHKRWPRYLVLLRLRKAEGGAEWDEAVALLDSLAAAVEGRGPPTIDTAVLAKGLLATGGYLEDVDRCVDALRAMRARAPAPAPRKIARAPEPAAIVKAPPKLDGEAAVLATLRTGRRFSIAQMDGQRCQIKLSWIGKQGRRYLFVDRAGQKFAELDLDEVLAMCADGRIAALDDDSEVTATRTG